MPRYLACTLTLFAVLMCKESCHAAEAVVPPEAKVFLGCWSSDDPNAKALIRIEPQRFSSAENGQLSFFAAQLAPGKLIIKSQGRTVPIKLELKSDKLIFTPEGGGPVLTFSKLSTTPDELELKPLKLGTKKEVPAEELKEIQFQFAKRLVTDQEVRKDQTKLNQIGAVDTENTRYITKLIQEYGWIDVKRFGQSASNTAFLIVQHIGTLPLMISVLPEIEKDMKAGLLNDGQNFALLYDRTQLYLGNKQKYGTQVGQNDKGDPIVLPLEDKTKVEQYRKELRMFSLEQYLSVFEKQFGKKVQFSDD